MFPSIVSDENLGLYKVEFKGKYSLWRRVLKILDESSFFIMVFLWILQLKIL